MKTFRRAKLPTTINYNGRVFTMNPELSAHASTSPGYVPVNRATTYAIGVLVLSRKLRGKTDLYGQPYQPTKWVFTSNK